MQIEKNCILPVPIQNAWDCLCDADLVASCVPGVEKVERVDDSHFLVTVTVKVGVIKPTFRLNVTLVDQAPPTYLRSTCTGEANGMMGSLRQSTQITLSKINESETRVDVNAEVDVFGRLGTFGYGVLKGKADQLWEQFVANLSAAAKARTASA